MFNRLFVKYYADNVELNIGSGGKIIATDEIGSVQHELVKLEFGTDGNATMVSTSNPLPVTDAASEAALASIAAEDFATQTTLAAVLAKLSSDPATQTTLAAILAKLISNPATDTLQTTGNTTLASILAKIIAAPSTEAKQDTIITALNSIDAGTAAALGQALMAASVPVTIASNQSAIPVSGTISVGAVDNTQLYSNTLAVTGAITGIETTGYQSIIFSFSGVWVGLLLIEGSEDNAIWEQKIVLDVNEFAMQDVINENGIFQIKSSSKYIRINVQQVSGTITALIVGRTVPGLNAADSIAFAMDRSFNMPLYVSEIETKKDISNALIPSDAPKPIYGSAAATSSVIFLVDTTGYQSVAVQAIVAGSTINVQTSNDGITWATLNGLSSNSNIPLSTVSTAGVIYIFPTTGRFVRGLMAGANFTTCLVYLRQEPAIGFLTVGASMNITSIGGTSVGTVVGQGAVSTYSTGGLLAVGGNVQNGTSTVNAPIMVGGREAPSDGFVGGKVRTLLTDTLGKAIVTGDIPAAASIQNLKSVPTQELSQFEGQSQIELLAQILIELKINNQMMSDLPLVLSGQAGKFDEPQQYRNDSTLFAVQ